MQTILVTGGAGYIGSHTAFLLAQQGYRVIIIDSLRYQQPANFPWATFFQGDFGDTVLLNNLFSTYDIDAVMHFAAYIEVAASVKNPLSFYDNNVVKTVRLLETMHAHNITQFIFSSSCAVYGKTCTIPLTESHPTAPISPYGMSKLIVENILEDISKAYDFNYVSLRYFNAAGALPEYGLGEYHEPETHLIPLLLQAAYTQQLFTLFGDQHATPDGSCIRDYVHVVDIAQAHILALRYIQRTSSSNIFNLGTGKGTSVKEMIKTTELLTGLTIPLCIAEKRAGDPPILVADATKAHEVLTWNPQHSIGTTIIANAHAYYKQRMQLKKEMPYLP